MAILSFKNVGISAVAACVPKTKFHNNDLINHSFGNDEIEKIIKNIGIEEKRIASADDCASDLCIRAANELFEQKVVSKESIDVCIFLSQSPDYKIPATAPLIQHKLGLSSSTICFDVNLACSGYIYGLSLAFMYADMPQIRNVLLLVGETFSKLVSDRDKVNFPLYGDAGTASLISKGDFGMSYFDLNTDGSGFDMVKINSGQCRAPFSKTGLEYIDQGKFGSLRDIDLFMDGLRVFNFAIKNVPSTVKRILDYSNIALGSVSDVVFHQANKFMTDFLAKKLKITDSQMRYSIRNYGNTSSASIPLTLVVTRSQFSTKSDKVLLCGFGAGMSWGTAIVNLGSTSLVGLCEYDGQKDASN